MNWMVPPENHIASWLTHSSRNVAIETQCFSTVCLKLLRWWASSLTGSLDKQERLRGTESSHFARYLSKISQQLSRMCRALPWASTRKQFLCELVWVVYLIPPCQQPVWSLQINNQTWRGFLLFLLYVYSLEVSWKPSLIGGLLAEDCRTSVIYYS